MARATRATKKLPELRIVYDCVLKRPACPLLQVFGGTVPTQRFGMLFDSKVWLTSRTPDMRTYRLTEAQLDRLVEITRTHAAKAKSTRRHR